MTKQFNREYKEYKPTSSGPPTARICKKPTCKNNDGDSNPSPPNPVP